MVYQQDGTVISQYLLGEGEHTIGRDPNSAIYCESAYISNDHAKLHLSDEGIFIEDLKSTSGTFLDQVSVRGKVRLTPGQRLQVGDLHIDLQLEGVGDLSPGVKIGSGRYELVKELGRGAMGQVWLAQDTQLDENVAIKVLPSDVANDAVCLLDLKREVQKSRKLSHDNIIRIHDLIQLPGENPFVTLEYVEGTDLHAIQANQTDRIFEWEDLKPYALQLCDALNYAHERKIVHRDLKPANIMVTNEGVLKLADFGIAASIADATGRSSMANVISGTPQFMSPQQMLGESPKASDDIYALGATIYCLLTGRPPFHTGDIAQQAQHITPAPLEQRLKEFGLQNEIPKHVNDVVMSCLAKDVTARPSSVGAIGEWLRTEGKSDRPAERKATETTVRRMVSEKPTEAEPALDKQQPSQEQLAGQKKSPVLAIAAAFIVVAALGWAFMGGADKDNENANLQPVGEGTGRTDGNQQSSATDSLKEGLVAYYPFNGNANDESGNGNDGEVKGATPTTDRHGKENKAYRFDGVSTISTPQNNFPKGDNPRTVSIWFLAPKQQTNNPISVLWGAGKEEYGGKTTSIQIWSSSSISIDTWGNPIVVKLPNAINNSRWNNFTWSYSEGVSKSYLNGSLVEEKERTIDTEYDFSVIGGNSYSNKERFTGKIDDLRIYNRALSADEISALYNLEKPKPLEWDFTHHYSNVMDPAADSYLHSAVNAVKYAENAGNACYWAPEVPGKEAKVTYKYSFKGTTKRAWLDAILWSYNFGGGRFGKGSLWASKDGENWIQIIDAPTPGGKDAPYHIREYLPQAVLGGRELWLQTRMQTEGLNILSQFSRYGLRDVSGKVYSLKVNLEPENKPALTKGLVAYYPFNGNANDESGQGNDGEVKGATLAVDRHGKENKAYQFKRSEEANHIEIPNPTDLHESKVKTISAWIQVPNTGYGGGQLIRNYSDDTHGENGWKLAAQGNTKPGPLYIIDERKSRKSRVVKSFKFNEERWYHLVSIDNDSQTKLYLNGREIASQKITAASATKPNTRPLLIGGFMDPTRLQGGFNGKIDDVRIYDRALSDEEVSVLYDLEKPSNETQFTEQELKIDGDIEAKIRESINKPEGELTDEDLLKVTKIDFGGDHQISNFAPLSRLKNLTELSASGTKENPISSLNFLAGLKKLQILYLGNGNAVTSLEPLGALTNLESVCLGNNNGAISNLMPLGALPNLVKVDFRNDARLGSISNIKGISRSKSIKSLHLPHNKIKDISELAVMKQLEELDIHNNPITDVSALSSLINLRELSIGHGDSEVGDWLPISNLANLERFNGGGTEKGPISSLSFLTGLQKLHTVNINYASLKSFESLSSLPKWKKFCFANSMVNINNLQPLGDFPELVELDLRNDARKAFIYSVMGLGKSKSIKFLHLPRNKITDVSELSTMTQLQELTLNDNPLKKTQIEELQKALPNCKINHDATK